MSEDGPGPAIVIALMIGTVTTVWLLVRLFVWLISAALVLVQG